MSVVTQGSFACAMVHRMQPHVIWLFRRSNPCDIVLFENIGVLSWSSEKKYIDDSIGGVLDNNKIIQLPPNSGIGIDLHRNRTHRFTLETPKYLTMY
jgi:hypothetical protein